MTFQRIIVIATLLALALVGVLLFAGAMPWQTAALCVIGIQAVALSVSEYQPVLYITGLTPEQVKEFTQILGALGEYKDVLPDLKNVPNRLKSIEDQVSRIARLQLAGGGGGDVIRPGQLVSDKCAEHLVGLVIVAGQRQGKFDLLETPKRESLINLGRSFLGDGHFKTALSSTDIPLPTEYSGQVVQLVGMYGQARRYGTVFPAGTGQLKLPRLKTDPAFTLLSQSTAIAEKSPQTEWVTFNPEKFGGLIRLPSELDEDSIIPLGNFIADYAARNIALCEDTQFFVSTGAASGVNGSVEGLCKATQTNSKVTTSTGLGSPSEFTLTHFRTLRTIPAASALRFGAYYLHPTFEPMLAGFNTSGNKPYNPLAQIQGSGAQPFQVGPTLDGFPIRWIDVMPVFSTADVLTTVHVLFGDARFQYLTPRGPVRFQTSVDAAFATDEILVRALERFTVGLMATSAVAGLQTAAA